MSVLQQEKDFVFMVVLLIDFSRFDSANATSDCIGHSQAPLPYRSGLGRYHQKFLIPNQKDNHHKSFLKVISHPLSISFTI